MTTESTTPPHASSSDRAAGSPVVVDPPRFVASTDGHELQLRAIRPAEAGEGEAILCVHGLFSDSRSFLGGGDQGPARFLAERVFHLDPAAITPAHAQRDDVDYVPTRPAVLFGHHFASITGLAPMLGPAVAVIWGWGPALAWVVLGAIFVGCVHDLAAMVLSVRSRGMSVGEVAGAVIGPRARALLHLIIFFGVALAMGVFVYVIARLFAVELAPGAPGYPQAVFPSLALMIVAAISGYLMHRRGVPLLPVAIVGFVLELAAI
ncbi:MAG: carbon starvation protein A, partial [Myxococcales bacterium]|nr:carbon starvation protein A [Myxococcales bacterium]